jgi:hypothetical protein
MGLMEWLFNKTETKPIPLTFKKEYKMDFKEFTEKFRGGTNPDTGNSWVLMGDVPVMARLAGVSSDTVESWIKFWFEVQVMPLFKKENRMPTNGEIITEWNFRQGIPGPPTVTAPVGVTLTPKDPATSISTPFGLVGRATKPAGLTLIGQYTPDQYEELMHHILCEHDTLAKQVMAAPAVPKALTVSVVTDYQQQSILTWPFQKVIELWDALAHKG